MSERDADEEDDKPQRLWPVHCVQGTGGAEIIEEIDAGKLDVRVRKGMEEGMEM